MNLEFFIASLPMLLPGQPAKITADYFLTACADALGADMAAAAGALLGRGESRHPFVTAWKERDRALRAAIASRRAARLRKDPAEFPPDAFADSSLFPGLASAVEAAYNAPDPLSRENAIDRIRWNLADEMQGVQPFSENVVLAYAVKLSIASRQMERSEEAGRSRFGKLTEFSRSSEPSQE